MQRGKIDPEVDELPRDHVNRPKVVFALYQLVKRNVAKCVLNRAPVRTGNASSRTIFVNEQDSSAALLKVENILHQIGFGNDPDPAWTLLSELKLQQDFLLVVNSRLQQLCPDLIRMQPNVACSPYYHFWNVWAGEQAKACIPCSPCTVATIEMVKKCTRYSVDIALTLSYLGGGRDTPPPVFPPPS